MPGPSKPASHYLREILAVAAEEDASGYARLTRGFHGRVAHIAFEDDEPDFYVRGNGAALKIVARKPRGDVHTEVTLSRDVIFGILQGSETPVEAFFLGHLRAHGTTDDLYRLHRLFILMAETAVRSERIQALVEQYRRARPAGGRERV